MPVRSPYPDVEIPEVSLYDFLFTDFGDRAGAPALIDGGSGASLTFAELQDMVLKIAAALAERGIGAGDVVALFAPNMPHYVAVFHGILRANAIVTSVNSLYTPGELAHQLADSGAKLVFTVSPFLDRASPVSSAAQVILRQALQRDPAHWSPMLRPDVVAPTTPADGRDRPRAERSRAEGPPALVEASAPPRSPTDRR
jgi:acyl-CoA synthetase (AMP-forming)/AMP-acid ligase II